MGEAAKNRDPMREAIADVVREVIQETDPHESGRKLSQRTIESARGIPPRVYLAHTRDADLAPSVLRVGKLRLVPADAYDAFLARLDERARAPQTGNDDADAILSQLGLSRPGPGGKK
jgi:hypothetical protein